MSKQGTVSTATDSSEEVQPQQARQDNIQKQPRQKHRGLIITLVSLFALLILVPVFIAGWFGFVPGLSDIMGARTAKDLGVTWTPADLASYKSKTSTEFLDFASAPANPDKLGKKSVFADPKTVQDLGLTQEEITAAINSLDWELMPLSNVQVRLTPGAVEVSGNLNTSRVPGFINFIGGVGYSDSDVQKAVDWGNKFVNGAAIYAKGQASVANDKLSFSLDSVQVGRFTAPADIASKVIYTGGTNGINNTKYLQVKNAAVEQGKLVFSGTYPTTIYVKQ